MRRTRWIHAVTMGALAAGAVGLACETWALACRTIDLDDTAASADGLWVDRDDEPSPLLCHPAVEAAVPPSALLPSPVLVAGFRMPVPQTAPQPQAVASAHSPRAPPVRPQV